MNTSHKAFRLVSLCVTLVALIAACAPPPHPTPPHATATPTPPLPTATPAQPTGCIDFSGYADDTKFGNPFSMNGYQVKGLGVEPLVNSSSGVMGFQFPDAGLEVDLPAPSSVVTVDVAAFSSRLTLSALDGSGVAVATDRAPSDKSVHSISLSGNNILRVTIMGGGNEGILVRMCSIPAQPPVALVVCVDFEPPLALGTQYGKPVGQQPGDVAFTTANGIPVTVWDFKYTGGGGTFGLARIESAPASFGSGQSMRANNINLEFDFSHLGFQPSVVDFEFFDQGGFENLDVNGSPSPVFAGELSTAPTPIGGANLSISTVPATGGKKGTAKLLGKVTTLRIGGQEFWIDNVCARK